MRKTAFLLSLAAIFTIPWETVVEHPALGSATRLVGFALVAFWAATVVLTGRFRKPSVFHLVAFLYVGWNATSVFWSADADRTIDRALTFVQLFALAYIMWDLLTTRANLLAGLQVYVLGCYVTIGNTLSNYFSGSTYYYQRFSASGTNPDDLGAVLALGIPLAWYLAESEGGGKLSRILKFVNYVFIPAAFLGIALSATRSALIATLPGMLFGLASLSRLKLPARLGLFVLLTAAIFVLFPLIPQASLERLGTTGAELSGGDFNGRKAIWRDGLAAFAEHPIFGVGSNMFRSVTSVRTIAQGVGGPVVTGTGKVAHNSFLSVLVEVGLIGFALFGLMVTIAIFRARAHPRWESFFWFAVLGAWAVSAFTLTWENTKPTWLFLSLVVISANLPIQSGRSMINALPQIIPGRADRRIHNEQVV